MGIKLSLDVETPLTPDDRDILAGISVMMLAIANRQDLVNQPNMEGLEGEPEIPCGAESGDGRVCIKEAGHTGRHRYRALGLEGPLNWTPQGGGATPPSSPIESARETRLDDGAATGPVARCPSRVR